jgi:ABC-type amino acid transport system permease subunit
MRGFSLLETLMYLCLFALVMEGTLSSIFSITESANRNATKAYIEQEGDFIEEKIDYEISQASLVYVSKSSNSQLNLVSVTGTTTSLQASGDFFTIIRSGVSIPFSSNLVRVSNVSFSIVKISSLYEIFTTFALIAKSNSGQESSEDFESISYSHL